MGCVFDRMDDGSIVIMCGGKQWKPNPCRDCCCEADYLCDYPVGDDKTCDAKICGKHVHEVAPGIHYCESHYDEFMRFEESGGVKRYLENVVPYPEKRRARFT